MLLLYACHLKKLLLYTLPFPGNLKKILEPLAENPKVTPWQLPVHLLYDYPLHIWSNHMSFESCMIIFSLYFHISQMWNCCQYVTEKWLQPFLQFTQYKCDTSPHQIQNKDTKLWTISWTIINMLGPIWLSCPCASKYNWMDILTVSVWPQQVGG